MRMQPNSTGRPRTGRLLRFAVLLGGAVALSIAAAACTGDDEGNAEPTKTSIAAAITTATAGVTSEPTRASGTLIPIDTPIPSPTSPATASTTATAPRVVRMHDMAPCSDETYFEEQTLPSGVHAVTYKDVPEGTPILFPFEEGRLRLIDARAGAILLIYDVEGVGIVSVQAAGSSTLDRTVDHVFSGTVIGHFGGTFEEDETDAFVGYQLFTVASTEELVVVNGVLQAGESVDPSIEDCIVFP